MSDAPKKRNSSKLIALGPSARETVNLSEFRRAVLLRRIILKKILASIRRMKLTDELSEEPPHPTSHAAT